MADLNNASVKADAIEQFHAAGTDGRPDTSFNSEVIAEFRAKGGKVGGHFEGASILLLTTTGAKTGKSRTSPVGYFDIDDKRLIVGSYAGADITPGWVYNLRANPLAHIEIGTESYDVKLREVAASERVTLWTHITETVPAMAKCGELTSRVMPIFEVLAL